VVKGRLAAIGLAGLMAVGCGSGPEFPQVSAPPPLFKPTPPPPPPGYPDVALERFALPLSVADAERILLRTRIFHYSDPAPQIQAWHVLMDQPDRAERFRGLATGAEWAGQLYALCALSALDDPSAAALASRLSSVMDTTVAYQSDQGGPQPVASVVRLIRDQKMWRAFESLREVPVRIVLIGEPLNVSATGQNIANDGILNLQIPALYADQEISGQFSGNQLIVGFRDRTDAGGAKVGSLRIVEGPGSLPEALGTWQAGCVAVWRSSTAGLKPFRLRFTVTAKRESACH
jgi:hypothetical protein